HQNQHREHGESESEIKRQRSDAQWRNEASEQPDRRVSDRIDRLRGHETRTLGSPSTIEQRNVIQDEPRKQHKDVDQQDQVNDRCDPDHQAHSQDWSKPADSGSAFVMPPCPETAMFSGESRNTLLVTRSIRPYSP